MTSDEPGDPDREGTASGPPARIDRALVPSDPFRRYLAELRKYPALTREDEQALARRYRATGDRDALFRLVTSNLMVVVRVALSFRRAARNLLDLVQEGNLGLLAAIERFDPEVGVRLPTYATWWIRAYIVKYLLDNVRLVRVGTTNARRKLLRNLRDEKARLEAAGFDAGPKMLAERFGVSEADVTDVASALHARDVSLDAPVGDPDGRTHGDMMAASGPGVEEEVARRELQEKVQAAIGRFRGELGERERAILDDRLLSDDPVTLQVIGDRFGTTREAVRQAEARLMSRLKEYLVSQIGDLASIRVGPS
ncbi:MAG TPA: sigma-70 family RNA polymerase sigma factor [Candidatus Polarisedimenticolaceae bacterium]|nr:sigma-70 family RNA polymerase sigma factor [Candidatus Polarisedimenticolaceae bacterium]